MALEAQRRRSPLDRLTASDLMQVRPEDEGWPQRIGALAILREEETRLGSSSRASWSSSSATR
jgi:hypothetical protein